MSLSFETLRRANIARQREWDPQGALHANALFAAVELAGEVGELLNVIKKRHRATAGVAGGAALDAELREEMADVVICASLLAIALDVDLEAAIEAKFNATSKRHGFTTRLAVTWDPTSPSATDAGDPPLSSRAVAALEAPHVTE